MNDELRERAKAYGETNRTMGGDGWQMMADFATEQSDIAAKDSIHKGEDPRTAAATRTRAGRPPQTIHAGSLPDQPRTQTKSRQRAEPTDERTKMHGDMNTKADYTVLTGSNLDHLPTFADAVFDSCVTDPPYELGFMGKAWDKSGIAYSVDMWREVYRVLKPGAYLLAFGGSRTYHRLASAIEDAGFEIRDQIQWIYGQGFPKSLDLNKAFCLCNIETDRAKPYDHQIQTRLAEGGESSKHSLRPLLDADLSPQIPIRSTSGQVLQSSVSEQNTQRSVLRAEPEKGITVGKESSVERRRDAVQNEGQLQRRDLSTGSRMGETDGTEGRLHNGASLDNGSDVRTFTDTNGGGQPQGSSAEQQPTNQPRIISNQRRPQAGRINEICSGCGKPLLPTQFDRSQIEGLGTALKPAHEPIVMARKPLEKGLTVAQNVLKWGTGAINVDGCRISTDDSMERHTFKKMSSKGSNGGAFGNQNHEYEIRDEKLVMGSPLGRFPANVIHDGSDEVLAAFPHTASGQPCGIKAGGQGNVFGEFAGGIAVTGFGDEGSAARFFYSPKASKYDREAGLPEAGLPEAGRGVGALRDGNRDNTMPARNHHPTVKPTDLMQYLCRLVTPPGGLVLDPFLGSGSTAKAALIERFRIVGIELNPEYAAIADARCKSLQVKLF